jgi:AcrR family transcriptional regulator
MALIGVLPPDPTIHRQVVAAARSLLTEDPGAPITSIVQRAGVSRATFYRHFGSRGALLRAVELEPPATARERILAAGAELLATRGGLHGFSMDELATAAGVSRATVYRIMPSKARLFGELLRHYSPFEEMLAVIQRLHDRPPTEVLPEIVRVIARIGSRRLAIMRAFLLQATGGDPDAVAGIRPIFPQTLGVFAGYMAEQMARGRLRPMHPILAIQACMGPVVFHLLTRPVADQVVRLDVPIDEAVEELAQTALHGLLPEAVA